MLSPSELADLGTWLRKCGFAVTSTQLIAAGRLLNGTRQFASREELAAYLAPLFCSDARMQQRFRREYEAWLGQMGLAADSISGTTTAVDSSFQPNAEQKTSSVISPSTQQRRLRFNWAASPQWLKAEIHKIRWGILTIYILSSIAVLASLAWFTMVERAAIVDVANSAKHVSAPNPQATQNQPTPPPSTPSTSSEKDKSPSASIPFSPAEAEKKEKLQRIIAPLPTVSQALFPDPLDLILLVGVFSIFAALGNVWATGRLIEMPHLLKLTLAIVFLSSLFRQFYQFSLIAIMLCVLLWWLLAKQRQYAFLRRLPADTPSAETLSLSVTIKPLTLLSEQIKHLGPALRQRRRVHTREIDVIASVHATVRAGGIATPVFGSKQEPEYLLLVDRSSRHDHFAALADALVAALHAQGVWLERYQFDGDLQQLHHQPFANETPHTGPQTLNQLAKRHADARLIVFSDGAGLIDRYSSDVHANVMRLHAWPRPLQLTPHARASWAAREWRLAHAGLQMLPMDDEGLSVLRHLYEARGDASAVADETRHSLGPLFLHNQDLWLDRVAPPQAEIEGLLQALKDELGKAGFAWLAACAVYPEIHWGITLALGESLRYQTGTRQAWQLQSREQHAASLLQLAHLPWLRHGFMPAWLRQRLLEEIPADCHTHVKQELETLLQALAQTNAGGDLQVHTPSRWQQIWQRWRKPTVPEAANDKVFLSFMGGTPFALKLTGPLRRWLYPQGLPLAGPRGGPVFLALLLVVGLLVLWPEKNVEPELLPQACCARVTPTPTASVVEGAASAPSVASITETTPAPAPVSASASAQAPSATLASAPKPTSAASSLPVSASAPASAQTLSSASAAQLASTPNTSQSTPSASTSAAIEQSSSASSAASTRCEFCPEMLIIPAGSFRMGDDKSKWNNERPAHMVQVASFMLGKFEVTQAQWRAVMGSNPSFFKDCGEHCPVENVSWNEIQTYLQKLSALTGQQYRLPSEAEWEYAARAGSQSKRSHGDDETKLVDYAWYDKNSTNKTHAVGQRTANAFGLFDMHGNVWEWVADCWHDNYHGAPLDGSAWVKGCDEDNRRVLRGGSWFSTAAFLRSACRSGYAPANRDDGVGFRVARTLP